MRMMRRARHVLAVMALVAMTTALASTSTVAASPSACRVKNLESDVTKASLQKAVYAASGRDRLTVRGTCRGHTRINKNLTISGVKSRGSGKPTLLGGGGSVVDVANKQVALQKLVIRGSKVEGIRNSGILLLRSVIMRHNLGRGVHNSRVLKLLGSTSIRYDTGGGVLNDGRLMMWDTSSISSNSSSTEGGGVLAGAGTAITMGGKSSISGNSGDHFGGGVWIRKGTLTMVGSSSISGNTATDANPHGGGIYAEYASLVGVACHPDEGANVLGNVPDDCYTWPS